MSSVRGDVEASREHLLDLGTQLVGGEWFIVVAPEVGEASGACMWPYDPRDRDSEDGATSAWSMLPGEVRQELNASRALRRATKRLRQYAVQNKLTALHTLTYRCVACDGDPCRCGRMESPATRAIVKRDVAAFIKSLRSGMTGGEAFPYGYVIERGTKGTKRLHVHLLLPSEYAPELVSLCWKHGRTDYSPPKGDGGKRSQARRAASYLAKYLSKSLGDEDEAWAHSYERAQGFNVRQVKRRLRDITDVVWFVEHYLGEGSRFSVCTEWAEYEGPPAFVAIERDDDG